MVASTGLIGKLLHFRKGPIGEADALAAMRKRLMRAFAGVTDKDLKLDAHVAMARDAFLVAVGAAFVVGQAADLEGGGVGGGGRD